MIQSYSKRDECITHKKGKNVTDKAGNGYVAFAVEYPKADQNGAWYRYYSAKLDTYVNYIVENREKEIRMHDIVTPDEPVKLFFDMDVKSSEMRTTFEIMEHLWHSAPFTEEMSQLISLVRDDYRKGLDDSQSIRLFFYTMCINHVAMALGMHGKKEVSHSDFILSTACRNGKLSAHIVCDGIVFRDASHLSEFINLLRIRKTMLSMETRYTMPLSIFSDSSQATVRICQVKDMFDPQVYPFDGSCKLFRTLYSSKIGVEGCILNPVSLVVSPMYKEKRDGFEPLVVNSVSLSPFSKSLIERSIPTTRHAKYYEYSRYGIPEQVPLSTVATRLVKSMQCGIGMLLNPSMSPAALEGFCNQVKDKYTEAQSRGTKLKLECDASCHTQIYNQIKSALEPCIKMMSDQFGSRVCSRYKSRKISLYKTCLYITLDNSPCFGRNDITKAKSDPSVCIKFSSGELSMHCFHKNCIIRNRCAFGTDSYPIGFLEKGKLDSIRAILGDQNGDYLRRPNKRSNEQDATQCPKKLCQKNTNQ